MKANVKNSYIPVRLDFLMSSMLNWNDKLLYLILQAKALTKEEFEIRDLSMLLGMSEPQIGDSLGSLTQARFINFDEITMTYSLVDTFFLKGVKLAATSKRGKATTKFSPEGEKFSRWFAKYLYKSEQPVTELNLINWAVTFDKVLRRCPNVTGHDIVEAMKYAVIEDKFWRDQFVTPNKLLDKTKQGQLYIYYFLDLSRKIKYESKGSD